MTTIGLQALPGLTEVVLAHGQALTPEQWNMPSECPGWSTHDVITHLLCTFVEIVDPARLPAPVFGSVERSNDAAVNAFRHLAPESTLAEYAELAPEVLAALTDQQEGAAACEVVDFADAGSYPQHLIADSLVFDHFCHLRHDLVDMAPDLTDRLGQGDVLESSLSWLIAGLPQMSPPRLVDVLNDPVQLELTGSGGGVWTLSRGEAGVLVDAGHREAVARITSTGEDFIRWGTHRSAWFDMKLTFSGDRARAESVADAIKVF